MPSPTATQPLTPVFDVQPTVVVAPVAPQQVMSVQPTEAVSANSKTKKSETKKIIIAAIAIVVLFGLGIVAWLLLPSTVYSGLPLKEYSTDKFVVLIPDTYVKYESSSGVRFQDPRSVGDTHYTYRSSVYIDKYSPNDDSHAKEYIAPIVEAFNKSNAEAVINIITMGSQSSISNKHMNVRSNGSIKVYEISAQFTDKNTQEATFGDFALLTKDGTYYQVIIQGDKYEPKMEASAHKIIDSFQFK